MLILHCLHIVVSVGATVCSLGAAAGLVLAPALYDQEKKQLAALEEVSTGPIHHPAASLPFASINPLTLAVAVEPSSEDVEVEPVTGLEFPKLISSQKPCCRGKGPFKGVTLAGLGVRSKRLLGLANIRVYAFGTAPVLAVLHESMLHVKNGPGFFFPCFRLTGTATCLGIVGQWIMQPCSLLAHSCCWLRTAVPLLPACRGVCGLRGSEEGVGPKVQGPS